MTVYAGAIVFQALLPEVALRMGPVSLDAFWIGALSTVAITGIYTVFGGMRAIMATSTPQAVVILLGSFIITAIGLSRLGDGAGLIAGWNEMTTAAKTNATQFAFWRPLSDPDFPWLGVLIASPIIGIWYWCTDQYIVQRTLTAKDLATARRGALFGGILKIWPVFIFLIPGLIGWTLDQKTNRAIDDPLLTLQYSPDTPSQERIHATNAANARLRELNDHPDAAGRRGFFIQRELRETTITDAAGHEKSVLTFAIQGDQVFPTLVTRLLPAGIRGLIVACLLAALMSSLASLFNSSASLFTVDVYEKIRPGKPARHLLHVGRLATAVVVGIGIIWIPVMKQISSGGLYQYLQSVQGYLAPPITAVFLLGLFWRRMNATGAVAALSVGFTLGMAKLTLQSFYGQAEGKLHDPALLAAIGDFNFLYASGVLFLAGAVTMIGVSLATAAPPEEKTRGLTYQSIHELETEDIRSSWDRGNKIMAGLILACVLGTYLYFSFWLG